jgi:hypothetical protein
MPTVVIKTRAGRLEAWSRDDDDDFLREAFGRSQIAYEENAEHPLCDAVGFRIADNSLDRDFVRQALDATGVSLDWVEPAADLATGAGPVAGGGSALAAGQYRVELAAVQGDADVVAVNVRDRLGNVVDPRRRATLSRQSRPKDVDAALPPDTLYAGNQLHEILEAVRGFPRGA